MTSRTSRWTRPLGAVLMAAAVAIGAQACAVNGPTAPETSSPQGAQTSTSERSRVIEEIAREPTFTPFTRAPTLSNRTLVGAALEEEYPALLRGAGVGGTAEVWLLLDADGVLRDTRIDESSGHQALDLAALRVARVMRFSPAMDGGNPVPVWVSIPITFRP